MTQRYTANGDGNMNGPGSGNSDFSNAENDTDTLGRAILRHERDARRLQSMLGGSRYLGNDTTSAPHPSKRMQQLETKTQAAQDTNVWQKSVQEREPGYNIPASWGRKNKKVEDWTRLPRVQTAPDIQPTSDTDKDRIIQHRTAFTGDADWEQNGHTVEDTPPSMKRRRPVASQTSLRRMNDHLKDIVQAGRENRQQIIRPISEKVPEPEGANLDLEARLARLRQQKYAQAVEIVKQHKNKADVTGAQGGGAEASLANEASQAQDTHLSRPQKARAATAEMLERLAKVARSTPRTTTESLSNNLPVEAATPIITGGWVDTPRVSKASLDVLQEEIELFVDEDQENRDPDPAVRARNTSEITKPMDRRAALAEIVPETTVASTLHQTDSSSTTGLARQLVKPASVDRSSRPAAQITAQITEQEQPKNSEPATTDLDRHILQAVTSQQRPTRPSTQPKTVALQTDRQQTPMTPGMVDKNGKTVCVHCGSGYTSLWHGLWVELRSNFWIKDESAPFDIRLTSLGLAVILAICWYALESLLCFQYCKPRYATPSSRFDIDPRAPEYPFVIPTLLARPFEIVWRPAYRQLKWLGSVISNWILGDQVLVYPFTMPVCATAAGGAGVAYKSVKQPGRWLTTSASIAAASSRRAVESVVEAIDDIGRMW